MFKIIPTYILHNRNEQNRNEQNRKKNEPVLESSSLPLKRVLTKLVW